MIAIVLSFLCGLYLGVAGTIVVALCVSTKEGKKHENL